MPSAMPKALPHPEERPKAASRRMVALGLRPHETRQGRSSLRAEEFAMLFDLIDLQLFIAVAETRSITAGAGRVHLALASASERIKGLEQALGVALLKRGRRGV